MTIKKTVKSIFTRFPRFYSIFFSSFDAYQRFKAVADLLDNKEIQNILDVGGDIGHLRYFLPKKEITIADVSGKADVKIKNTGKYRLPFKDKEFDAVVSIDTFQYVKKEQRKDFINELIRVAKKYVVVTAPFYSKDVVNAEKECNEFFKKHHKKGFHWFEKTLKNGYPKLDELKKLIKYYDYKVYHNANIKKWKKTIKTNIILHKYIYPFSFKYNSFCNIFCYKNSNKEPSYRKVILIKK